MADTPLSSYPIRTLTHLLGHDGSATPLVGKMAVSGVGGGTPGGSATQLQYHTGSTFGGVAGSAVGTAGGLTLNNGSVATNAPVLDLAQQWSAGGVAFSSLKLNVTNTASASGSKLLDLQVGGVNAFSVEPTSNGTWLNLGTTLTIQQFTNQYYFRTTGAASDATINCASINVLGGGGASPAVGFPSQFLVQLSANTLGLHFGASAPQAFQVYNTRTSASIYERGVFDWTTAANVLTIGTQTLGGGTTPRALNLVGSALTFNGSPIGGGGSPSGSATELQYRGGPSTFSHVVGSAVSAAGGLTLNNGSLLTSSPVLDLAQTWNASGVEFTGIKANYTNTLSASTSKLIDLQIDGVTRFNIQKPTANSTYLDLGNAVRIQQFNNSFYFRSVATGVDTAISCEAINITGPGATSSSPSVVFPSQYLGQLSANTLGLYFSTTPQAFQVYNTRTSASNYERGVFDWTTEADVLTIGTQTLAGDLHRVNIVGSLLTFNGLPVGGSVIIDDDPPVGAADGAMWWESDTAALYINYNDGSSTAWVMVDTGGTGGGGSAPGGVAAELQYRVDGSTFGGFGSYSSNTLRIASGSNAQKMNIYNYTDNDTTPANAEWLSIDQQVSVDNIWIYPDAVGTGVRRNLYIGGHPSLASSSQTIIKSGNTGTLLLQCGGAAQLNIGEVAVNGWNIDVAGHFIPFNTNQRDIGTSTYKPRTVYQYTTAFMPVAYASRPATPAEGMLICVTDSTVNTFGATVVGGGSNHVLAWYNGTNWTVCGI